MSAIQPMRVAQLVKCLGLGGTEQQLVVLLRELARGRKGQARVTPSLACLMKVGEYLPDVRSLGLEPSEFRLRGSLARPGTLVAALRIAAWIRRENASALHCHDFYTNVVGSVAARLAGVPWIVSRRDLGGWRGPAQARLLASVSRTAPMVLCNTRAAREQVVMTEGVAAHRVHVVPNGLDVEGFDRRAKAPPSPPLELTVPTVVLVANMKHGVKGHENFLKATVLVRRAIGQVRFLLVGDGDLRGPLEQQARETGLANAVIFAGARTDVAALLARSTIAVSASKSEGLSNAIMEAMAASLPVVATHVGGTAELVLHDHTGFLVEPDAPEALARRLIQLLRTPETARRFGVAGRRRIEEGFSSAALACRVSALYARLQQAKMQDICPNTAQRGGSDGRLSA